MKRADANLVPWIPSISPYGIAAVLQGGCESGAYMPAVTYHTAMKTMAEHGTKVLEYIDKHGWPSPQLNVSEDSWPGFCCRVLSCAVELWCAEHAELADWDDEDDL